jgi:hypothetical protein
MCLLKRGVLGELRRLKERLASLHERSEQQLTPAEASEVLADIVTANRESEEKMDEQRAHVKERCQAPRASGNKPNATDQRESALKAGEEFAASG